MVPRGINYFTIKIKQCPPIRTNETYFGVVLLLFFVHKVSIAQTTFLVITKSIFGHEPCLILACRFIYSRSSSIRSRLVFGKTMTLFPSYLTVNSLFKYDKP